MRRLSEYSLPTLLVVGFGIVLGIALIVAASTSTTAFGAYNSAWDGTAELRSVADETGTDSQLITNTTAYTERNPNETLALVLAPDQPYHDHETDRVARFVRQGGTVVVADERPNQTNALLAALDADARIDGEPLRDTQHYYRSPAAPIVRNISNHSLTANVSALTLNHGSAVTPHNATVLARTSGYAYRDTNGNNEPDQSEVLTDYPVATIEQVGDGHIIVVGDPSLFINTMLERTDNRHFVQNLFGAHETVLLDYSHTSSIPPLMQVLLIVRQTPLAMFVVGVLGVATIVLLRSRSARWDSFEQVLSLRWPQATQETAATDSIADSELVAYLRTQYPEWDDDRLDRIVTARRQHADHLEDPSLERSE